MNFKTQILILVFLLSNTIGYSQKTIVFIDSDNLKPVFGVNLLDCNLTYKGTSNEKGEIFITEICFPLKTKQFEYADQAIQKMADTVYLSLQHIKLDEVAITAKPIVKMDLYKRIIKESHAEIANNEGTKYGRYFQALMMINESKGDTSFIDMNCLMAIKTKNVKKSKDYTIYCKKGEKSFITFEDQLLDTSATSSLLNILPSFESNFKYDLSKTKKYKLKFEEKEIRFLNGKLSGLEFISTGNNSTSEVLTYFDNNLLLYWNNKNSLIRLYDGQNIFINFDYIENTYEFDTNAYELASILNVVKLTIFTNGSLFTVKMVQGFVPDINLKFDTLNEVDKVKSYFKKLPYSLDSNKYYSFN